MLNGSNEIERISKNLCLIQMFTDIYDSELGLKKKKTSNPNIHHLVEWFKTFIMFIQGNTLQY